jgi:aspartate racemase
MHHTGILGHSIEGATHCLLQFCREGFRTLGAHQHPDVTLDCIPMARSMPGWEAGDHRAVRAILAASAARLAAAGAAFFVCPDNTAHLALEEPGDGLALPGLHIAEVVADRAVAEGRRRVGVLGTRFTMEGPIYPRTLAARGIAARVPDAADRQRIHDVIFDELVNGVFTDASRREFARIVARLREDGCDGVALVCTEIPLLLTPELSPLPTLDSTTLLAHAALAVATGRRALPSWRGGPVEPPAAVDGGASRPTGAFPA